MRIGFTHLANWSEIEDFVDSNEGSHLKHHFIKVIKNDSIFNGIISPFLSNSKEACEFNIDNKIFLILNKKYLEPLICGNVIEGIEQLSEMLREQEVVILTITLQQDKSLWRSSILQRYEKYLFDQSSLSLLKKKMGASIFDKIDLTNLLEKVDTERFHFSAEIAFAHISEERVEQLKYKFQSILEMCEASDTFMASDKKPIFRKQYLTAGEVKNIFGCATPRESNVAQKPSREVTDTNQMASQEVLPISPQIDIPNDTDISIRLKKALKSSKIVAQHAVNIINVQYGTLFNRVQVEIPSDLTISEFTNKKAKENLQAALGSNSLSVYQGDYPGSVSFFIPVKERTPIYLSSLISNGFDEFAKNSPLPFIVGVDLVGKPIFECLNNLTGILVAGQTNGGKSVWLTQLITTLLLYKGKKDMELFLIDPKMVELHCFKDFQQVREVITNLTEIPQLMQQLIKEMECRYEKFSQSNCRNIKQYRELGYSMPYIVLIIDEYANLTETIENINDNVRTLTEKGRAAGIHLIIATQRPDSNIINGIIKANLPTKISFRLDNNMSYKTVFGEGIPTTLLGKGHGIMKREGQFSFEEFQGAVISTDNNEVDKTIRTIRDKSKKPSTFHKQEKEIPQICRLKKIIATTGETRVSYLQKQLKIRTATVNKLMGELVEEGWLKKGNSKQEGYSLIATEDQLQEYIN
ncbi:FtsK/SpoIIIE domain-containing protein [Shouchella clausii]|uniref:FtsK/SpoIIIE domain-containing protein n=1 Tax=Shouchella clausii TaxID=79880 RepID=UPI001C73864F|nr:FtsK/SpoIIIE domain-containing protein [Shouchella clausii]MBX0320162.1 hypothetical protein [Shouchella clausii]